MVAGRQPLAATGAGAAQRAIRGVCVCELRSWMCWLDLRGITNLHSNSHLLEMLTKCRNKVAASHIAEAEQEAGRAQVASGESIAVRKAPPQVRGRNVLSGLHDRAY